MRELKERTPEFSAAYQLCVARHSRADGVRPTTAPCAQCAAYIVAGVDAAPAQTGEPVAWELMACPKCGGARKNRDWFCKHPFHFEQEPAHPLPAPTEEGTTLRLADDADVEAVEALVGMSAGAWDMVDPHKLLDCVRLHFHTTAVLRTPAAAQFDAIMAAIPPECCVHGVPHVREEACPACAASDESDPLTVLAFCEGAIRDAIGLDDGLDGAAGEGVLAMIRNARAYAALRAPAPVASVLPLPAPTEEGTPEDELCEDCLSVRHQTVTEDGTQLCWPCYATRCESYIKRLEDAKPTPVDDPQAKGRVAVILRDYANEQPLEVAQRILAALTAPQDATPASKGDDNG